MSRNKREPRLTKWLPHTEKPTLVGMYEVQNHERWSVHWKHRLTGDKFRWWDGARWLTEKGGSPSIMGRHYSHQWRGLAEDPGRDAAKK